MTSTTRTWRPKREARRPLQPSLAAAYLLSTPPSPAGGCCCASACPLSPLRAAAPAPGLADAIRAEIQHVLASLTPHSSHERVATAEFVEVEVEHKRLERLLY